jgi:hypothetical protein|tara:strand:- start:2067 stop:2177 length:111 start_codon:yes stop_codon:yes gene_type:complete
MTVVCDGPEVAENEAPPDIQGILKKMVTVIITPPEV